MQRLFAKRRVHLIKLVYKIPVVNLAQPAFHLISIERKKTYPNSLKSLACPQPLKMLYPALLQIFYIEFLYPLLLYKLVKVMPGYVMLFQLESQLTERQSYFKIPT